MVEHKEEVDSLETPLISEKDDDTTPTTEEDKERTQVVAAGVGGAIVGLFILGPIGAALIGFTSAYAAEHKEGVVGDTARKMGNLTLTAKQKAFSMDSKYKASETATKTTESIWNKAKSVDSVGVLDKSKDAVVKTYASATTYVAEKRLLQKGTTEVGRRVCWLVEKVVGGKDKSPKSSTPSDAAAY